MNSIKKDSDAEKELNNYRNELNEKIKILRILKIYL